MPITNTKIPITVRKEDVIFITAYKNLGILHLHIFGSIFILTLILEIVIHTYYVGTLQVHTLHITYM